MVLLANKGKGVDVMLTQWPTLESSSSLAECEY